MRFFNDGNPGNSTALGLFCFFRFYYVSGLFCPAMMVFPTSESGLVGWPVAAFAYFWVIWVRSGIFWVVFLVFFSLFKIWRILILEKGKEGVV